MKRDCETIRPEDVGGIEFISKAIHDYELAADACTTLAAQMESAGQSIPAWKIEPLEDGFAICVDEWGKPEEKQRVSDLQLTY